MRKAKPLNKDICSAHLSDNKHIGIVGGDHSVPLGLIEALCEKHDSFGILHIDAHADLRDSYEGFEFSHASIMFNVLKHRIYLNSYRLLFVMSLHQRFSYLKLIKEFLFFQTTI